jgi:hypothetical protein
MDTRQDLDTHINRMSTPGTRNPNAAQYEQDPCCFTL